MPTPDAWQQAIRDAGFPLELDTDFDSDTLSGFLPCRFRDADSGFEYFSHEVDERERVECGAPGEADFAVTLVTHSDLREGAASIIAAGVLCKAGGGMLLDPSSGVCYSSERALAWVEEELRALEPYLTGRKSTRRKGL